MLSSNGFDWAEYCQVADDLFHERFREPIDECFCRLIISRAYYGVFCTARNCINSIDPKKLYLEGKLRNELHNFVRHTFSMEYDEVNNLDIGSKLKLLKDMRVQADYFNNYKGDLKQQARKSIELAKDALMEIEELKKKKGISEAEEKKKAPHFLSDLISAK